MLVVYIIAYLILGIEQPVVGISIVAIATAVISFLANLVLVQLPRYLIEKAVLGLSKWVFAISYSILAVLCLSLFFKFHFDNNAVEKMMYLNAATNGFVFGFAFYSALRPVIN
ncbi:MAG: hypothetical protein NVS3B25_11200 [Hymenobacter sp.]